MGEFQEPWYKRPDTNPNEPQDVDRAKQSELMIRFLSSTKNINGFENKSFKDILQNEEGKRIFINNLTLEQFENLLAGVNGILRNKNKDDWKLDGDNVALKGFVANAYPPNFKDKRELLEKTLLTAQKMNNGKRSLQDIALLLSSMINEIHAFGDGNGRTSRLVYHIIAESNDTLDKNKIVELLSSDGRYEIDIDPGHINVKILDLMENEVLADKKMRLNIDFRDYDDIEYNDELTEEEVILFSEGLEDDNSIMQLALYELIKHKVDKEKYLISYAEYPSSLYIKLKELIEHTSAAEFRQIIGNYWQLKKHHAELLIDIIASPDKKIYQIEEDGQKMSLKEYYEFNLDNNFMLNKNFNKNL